LVVILSASLIKERIFFHKGLGVIIGLLGAVVLVLYGQEIRLDAPNIPLGNTLFLVNAFFFALYLILAKKLLDKYHPITLMKWLFLFGVIINFPITLPEFLEIQWESMPLDIIWKIVFVVVGTTFFAYLFNIYALTQLKASTVSAFVYLQPLIGILFALFTGKDALTPVKILAAILVLLGVYLVGKRPNPGL